MNTINDPFILLAGGFGKRLQSINNNLPKPMVNISGKPFLEYLLLYLKSIGFRKFILCVYHMADLIENYFQNGEKWELSINYSFEDKPLGTAGAIGNINDLDDENFWVSNGDSYIEFSPSDMLRFQNEHDTKGTILLAPAVDENEYGNVVLDNNSHILDFKEKKNVEGKTHINAGIYYFKKDILQYIPKDKKFSLEYELLPLLIDKKIKLCGYRVDSTLYDIGTPKRLNIFQEKNS
ncbi:MAG: NTP transferase domain-containing protein [Bacteroidetes bacterium]|nr:NTP transferase domain-containing protein [Bacteroidota bacterium]